MTQYEAISALIKLIAHATEAHPHFECPRGQKDIAEARAAIGVFATGIFYEHDLRTLDEAIAKRAARITEPTYI